MLKSQQGLKDREEFFEIKCPVCGNPINKLDFWDMINGYAYYIASCWSGDVYSDCVRHRFKIAFEVPEDVIYVEFIKNDKGEKLPRYKNPSLQKSDNVK